MQGYALKFIFPLWLNGKESTCQPGEAGSIPGSERSAREGNGNPLNFCLGNSMGRGALADYSSWDTQRV